jgi:hypothetical protein
VNGFNFIVADTKKYREEARLKRLQILPSVCSKARFGIIVCCLCHFPSLALGRTIDYLEMRKDLNLEKLTYYGFSTGAYLGNIFPAVEEPNPDGGAFGGRV